MAAGDGGHGGLAARYASALFELADEGAALDVVAGDLKTLAAMVDESDDFRRFLKSPVLSRGDQAKAIAAIAAQAQLNALTQQFLGLVARNRRLFVLPQMIRGYLALLAERRGQSTVEVVSAVALSEAQINALAASLRGIAGRAVSIATKIDPSILGGLIVRVGSRMVDSSLKSKLQRLKLAMKGVG